MTTPAPAPAPRPGWWPPVRSVGSAAAALAGLVMFLAWMGGAFREKVHPGEVPVPRAALGDRPTAPVVRSKVPDTVPAVGSVQPRQRTEVSPQLIARIVDVKVRPGDPVEPGKPLVLLDDREVQSRLAEAQAAVTVAEADLLLRKTDYARAIKERDQGVGSASDFARYEGAFKVAEAQVKRAKESVSLLGVQLSYTKIAATTRGVVGDRFADPGDIAAPGKVLMVTYDPSDLELHVNVPESLAADVRKGMQLKVQVEAAGLKDVEGTVREVVPQAQQASRAVLVKVALPKAAPTKPLLPGMFGRVGLPLDSVDRLYVPRAAVRQIGQLDLVEVVGADGTLARRFVRLGPPDGARVEVLSGLDAGEVVALPAR